MTSTERPRRRSERLRPRNWSLPVKIIAVLLVPTLLGLGLGVLRIVEQIDTAKSLSANDQLIKVQDRVATLVGQLQRERDASAVFVAGNRAGDRSALKSVFGAVDGGLNEARNAIPDPAALGAEPARAYQAAQASVGQLPAVRDPVTGTGPTAAQVITLYTAIIDPVLALSTSLLRQISTTGLTGLASALDSLGAIQEQVSLQHAVVSTAIIAGTVTQADAESIISSDARIRTATEDFRSVLDPAQQAKYGGFTTAPANIQREAQVRTVLSKVGARGGVGVALPDWDATYEAVLTDMGTSDTAVRDDLSAASFAQQDKASNLAGVNSVILLLAILLGTTIVVLIARGLLKSLRTLRRTALDVANKRLPRAVQSMREGEMPDVAVEPVPVTSTDEIGQVARAFDAVHGQAMRLAAEQATLQANVSSMFVNLSRRSQALVERQLQLIEQLESNEQDPDQLGNLFQLDHLATRMRRNSENLLVLAGSDLAKRAGQPIPVVDVLRAAVSEVEQYQRVVVQPPPSVKILGRAASDLVHLLAELLDNATNFSAPDTQVVMTSATTSDGSVLVEIADRGVGLSTEEMSEANERLSGPAAVDVSASRRMGLFVVGRLASRHGISVRLGGPEGVGGLEVGVTASVSVPAYLVAGSPVASSFTPPFTADAPAPVPSMPASLLPAPRMVANGNGRPPSTVAAGSTSGVPNGASGPPNGTGHGFGAGLPPRRPAVPGLAEAPVMPGLAAGPPPGEPTASPGPGPVSPGPGAPGPGAPVPGSPGPGRPGNGGLPQRSPQASPQGALPRRIPHGSGQPGIGQSAPGQVPESASAGGGSPRDPSGEADLAAFGAGSGEDRGAFPPLPPLPTFPAARPAGRPRPDAATGGEAGAPTELDGDLPLGVSTGNGSVSDAPPPAPAPFGVPNVRPPATTASDSADGELFAANMPFVGSGGGMPGTLRTGLGGAPPGEPENTETTPIFEEIASAWFLSNRPIPVSWSEPTGAAAGQAGPAEEPAAASSAQPDVVTADPASATEAGTAAEQVPVPGDASVPNGVPTPGTPGEQAWTLPEKESSGRPRVPSPASAAAQAAAPPEERPAQPLPAQELPAEAFASAADAGWQAAAAAVGPLGGDQAEELTSAGLPKRRPRARLIPGAPGPGIAPPLGAPARSAETVRGRLASYQQGVREGRQHRVRRESDAATATAGSGSSETHDEESK